MEFFPVGIVRVGVILGGNFSGGICPKGIIRVAILEMKVFLVPNKLALSIVLKFVLFKAYLLAGIPNRIRFSNRLQLNISLVCFYVNLPEVTKR